MVSLNFSVVIRGLNSAQVTHGDQLFLKTTGPASFTDNIYESVIYFVNSLDWRPIEFSVTEMYYRTITEVCSVEVLTSGPVWNSVTLDFCPVG